MSKVKLLPILVVLALTSGSRAVGERPFPRLQGPYLGQKPPGMIPQPFAPGIITTNEDKGSSGFARNGTVFLYQKFKGLCRTFITRLVNGVWSAPELIPFWETMAHNGDFAFSSDDRTMLYQVKTELEGRLVSDIWKVELKASGWGDRAPLPSPVNTPDDDESFASDTAGGSVYFFSNRRGGQGRFDLYMCPSQDGRYGDAVNLGSLNSEFNEWDPFVAPDESYLIFCSTRPEGFGRDDLYITFKSKDGGWGPPVNMGQEVNSPGSENRPYVTRDGKYFFFTSTRNGSRDTFWVRAEYFDRFDK